MKDFITYAVLRHAAANFGYHARLGEGYWIQWTLLRGVDFSDPPLPRHQYVVLQNSQEGLV